MLLRLSRDSRSTPKIQFLAEIQLLLQNDLRLLEQTS